MMRAQIIAIDGPASSGKSTLGKKLADCLGYLFFDTGVLYRAITWAALQRSLDLHDEARMTELAENLQVDVRPPSASDGRGYDVWIDGQDVTWLIRSPEVDGNVSLVSAYPGVRQALIDAQRRIGSRGGVVMVGRDIGTVVLPDADLKIFLDASVAERAKRRHNELAERGEPADFQAICEGLRKRDQIDSTRQVAPLRPAADAIIINSDGLDIDQVLERAQKLVKC